MKNFVMPVYAHVAETFTAHADVHTKPVVLFAVEDAVLCLAHTVDETS